MPSRGIGRRDEKKPPHRKVEHQRSRYQPNGGVGNVKDNGDSNGG